MSLARTSRKQWQFTLAHCLDYYVDFHRVLWLYRDKVLVASFEKVTREPQDVINHFSSRFGLNAQPSLPEENRNSHVLDSIDRMSDWVRPDGSIDEMKVARPSAQRQPLAQRFATEFENSVALRRKLNAAEKLYRKFSR